MYRINQASFDPQPYDATRKLPVGSERMLDTGEARFAADWLGHVAAGRIGSNPPINEEARAIVLANERLMLGHRRPPSA